jgi:hypothetical protein
MEATTALLTLLGFLAKFIIPLTLLWVLIETLEKTTENE